MRDWYLACPEGDRVVFDDEGREIGRTRPVAYALVEYGRNGETYVDAVVPTREHPDDIRDIDWIDFDQQLVLASLYAVLQLG